MTNKLLTASMLLILVQFQYQIWLGNSSVRAIHALESELQAQQAVNLQMEARNRLLEIDVLDLKNGLEAVEERARSELGLIGEDEIFIQYVK